MVGQLEIGLIVVGTAGGLTHVQEGRMGIDRGLQRRMAMSTCQLDEYEAEI